MAYSAVKEVGDAEAKLLPLSFETVDSVIC